MGPMILSTFSVGADPIGPVSVCGALAVRAYGSTVWRGVGVRTVLYGDYM